MPEATKRFGTFEVLSLLGKGGMGEVYRARDTKLGRDVALKFLPAEFAADRDRMARFEREARVLASLNHPNIAQIYGLEESAAAHFLVLELVDGETLAERLRRGSIPIEEALAIAKQIAEGLEGAHEKDITHRDLKPANIKITPDGKVKVLDFGLAKALTSETSTFADSPTMLSGSLSQPNVILGTAPYMSPEQAKGRPVDRRTDVFSFGCVLFEMLTGHRAFDGENVTDTISRVLQRDPDWTRVPANIPGSIRSLLRVCLEKDVKRRRQTATDVRIDIEQALSEPQSSAAAAATIPRRTPIAWIAALTVAIAAIVVLAIVAAGHFREVSPPEMRLQILTPSSNSLGIALAPDGRHIVFVASGNGPSRLWLRSLDKTDAQPMTGTEGAGNPFWSADSRSIGFFAAGKLYRIDLAGGSPQLIANAPAQRGGCWNADGSILFAPSNGPLMRVVESGGEPVAVTRIDPRLTSHRWPACLPDGRHFLFFAQGDPAVAGIYLASIDGGEPKRLVASNAAGVFLNPDRLLFVQQGALVAQHLDLARQELTGDPVVVSDAVIVSRGLNLGVFSASQDGRIAYRATVAPNQLFWYDRTGKLLGIASEPDATVLDGAELSPDGRRVAFQRTVENNTDIWLSDLARDIFIRFTVNPATEQMPVWSSDSSRIAFTSSVAGPGNLYVKPSSGAGLEKPLLESPNNKAPQDWSKDGRFLLYVEVDRKTANDLWALDLSRNAEKRAVANSPFDERMGQFSPDARWVTYATNESGRDEIVVQPFPDASAKWQISKSGGTMPRWSADGRELYFIAPDGKLMASPVTASGQTFEAGTPQALFPTRLANGSTLSFNARYAVSREGRFLINQTAEDSGASPITLILNWNPQQKK